MSATFVIPVNHKDLLLGTEGRFNVEREINVKKTKNPALIASLADITDRFRESCLQISSNSNFDLLFSIARYVL